MAKEKFLLLSLQEDKAKKLAQIISNESCRRILDALADKDMTATQLSKKLDVPLSTVHYNLKNLVKSGLAVCEEFHFSQKGKEVNHYKLASKYIIIAPKSNDGFMDKFKGLLPVVGVVGAAALALQWSKQYFIDTTLMQVNLQGVAMESAPTAPGMAGAVMDDGIADAAVMETKELLRAAPDVLEASAKTAHYLPDAITSVTHVSFWQNIVLWFVIGAVVAIAAYFFVQYLKKK